MRGPLLLMGLVLTSAIIAAAVWWVMAGSKGGTAQGRCALLLAVGGLPFAVLVALVLAQFGIRAGMIAFPIFLACEIPAFCLGLLARRTAMGKAAMIFSLTLLAVSVVFLV